MTTNDNTLKQNNDKLQEDIKITEHEAVILDQPIPHRDYATSDALVGLEGRVMRKLDEIDARLGNTYTRGEIDSKIESAVDDSEGRTFQFLEGTINSLGTKIENTINGLATHLTKHLSLIHI